jgi:1,4-alpha-glucan branching enzyme
MQLRRAEPPPATTPARPVAPAPQASERPLEKPVDFSLSLPSAQSACLAGSFNNWDPRRTPLRKEKKGDWKTTLWLPPGRYEYRFVIDGEWMSDPNAKESAANGFGSTNSVVVV